MKNTEEWKDIEGFENSYQVSNLGNIRSLDRKRVTKGGALAGIKGRVRKQKQSKSGYMIINICLDGVKSFHAVHRLVAKAFVNNPHNKQTVNHIDGDKKNNAACNLEWATNSEQMQHAVDNNLVEVTTGPKFSKALKQEILNYFESNTISISNLAKMFGMSERTAGRIVNDGVKPRTTTRILKNGNVIVENILSKEDVGEIKRLRDLGHTLKQISIMFNRSISQIHRVVKGESRVTDIE